MALTPAGVAKCLGTPGLGPAVTHVSVHTADPGTTGANEVAGGTPAYVRKVPSYAAVTAGSGLHLSSSLLFDIPGGGTSVQFYGLWASGVFLGGNAVQTPETFSGQGTYSLSDTPITGS